MGHRRSSSQSVTTEISSFFWSVQPGRVSYFEITALSSSVVHWLFSAAKSMTTPMSPAGLEYSSCVTTQTPVSRS